MIKDNLVEEVHKSSVEWDWNSFLRSLWKSDSKDWQLYSDEQGGYYWDGRNLVQERSR